LAIKTTVYETFKVAIVQAIEIPLVNAYKLSD
jgi:hypothetical protein